MHSPQVPPYKIPTARDVLLVLYRSTDGPNWKNNTNWDTENVISDWDVVTVDLQGRVAELFLGSNNRRGIQRPTLRTLRFALVR